MAGDSPLAYERKLPEFFKIVEDAQRDLAQLVREAILTERLDTAARRRSQLAKVISYLDGIGAQIDPQARQLAADAFGQSAQRTLQQIHSLNFKAPEISSFTGVQRDALTALQDSITGRLGAARQQIGRSVDDLYAKAGRRAATRALLGADGSPQAAARQLAKDLLANRQVQELVAQSGVAFVDSRGNGWKLKTYTEMVTRTVTREAVVQGAITRMTAHGINVARVSVHDKPCPICAIWQGRLVSLDGEPGDYLGEAVTSLDSLPSGGPPMHPNCRHTLIPCALELDTLRAELAGPRPQLPPATEDTPQTIGNALDATSDVQQVAHRASVAINRVHATRGLPNVPVSKMVGRRRTIQGAYFPRTHRIELRTTGSHPDLTLVHEIGHLLDHLQIPGVGFTTEASSPDEILSAWRDAVNNSSAVANLHARRAGTTNPRMRTYLDYLLEPAELFARSYAQWIATRSGDNKLAEQLVESITQGYAQWEPKDFAAIGNALDQLFTEMGLKR